MITDIAAQGPFARKRHTRCSKHHHYSITSSARRRKDSGIFSPIALAVVRLMTSSNLVGCKTGRLLCPSSDLRPMGVRTGGLA